MTQPLFWIVNPDGSRAKRWESLLRREGWQVALEPDLLRFSARARSQRLGIALVDRSALGGGLAESLRKFKAAAAAVSVILTAGADLSSAKVIEALEAGADDHFPRQIDDRLFLAKIKAHLRRVLPSLALALDVLRSPGGEVKLDRSQQAAWVRNGRGQWLRVPSLTPTEFQFLTLFLEQPGKVLERRYIVETVWGMGEICPGTVDKHIEALRRKLGRVGSMICTVYGVGYAFRDSY